MGLDPLPGFALAARIRGPDGEFLRHIARESGVQVRWSRDVRRMYMSPPLSLCRRSMDEARGLHLSVLPLFRRDYDHSEHASLRVTLVGSATHHYPGRRIQVTLVGDDRSQRDPLRIVLEHTDRGAVANARRLCESLLQTVRYVSSLLTHVVCPPPYPIPGNV